MQIDSRSATDRPKGEGLLPRWALTFGGAVGSDELGHLELNVSRRVELHLAGPSLRELLHGVHNAVFLAQPHDSDAASETALSRYTKSWLVTYLPRIRSLV